LREDLNIQKVHTWSASSNDMDDVSVLGVDSGDGLPESVQRRLQRSAIPQCLISLHLYFKIYTL